MGQATAVRSVFLVDDHEIVRRGVKDLLELEPDLHVVGEAATVADALVRVPALRPDVAVLDIRLPDGNGVELCRALRASAPETACLMLTSYSDDEALLQAVLAGAAGYVLKQIRGSDLRGAVRTVAAGGSLLDATAAAAVMRRVRQPGSDDALAALSGPQRRILELIGEGLTNREIGQRMSLAELTVNKYVSAALAELDLQRRAQAAVSMTRFGDDHHGH